MMAGRLLVLRGQSVDPQPCSYVGPIVCCVLTACCVQVSELHRQLAPHMLRRLKKDVLKQLPPKMEQMVRQD